ncbi:hypothetical protein [Aurantivibrio plasticivorans]
MKKEVRRTDSQHETQFAMRSAYQLGVIARLSREIICCQELESIEAVIYGAARRFQLSGCFRAAVAEEQISIQFGKGISRQDLCSLAKLSGRGTKLSTHEGYIIFQTKHLLLVLLRSDFSEDEIDSLKDNLAVLIDTIHYWLDNYARLKIKDTQSRDARLAIAQKMNDIVNTMVRFSEHLSNSHSALCGDLSSKLLVELSTLGLEADQEEDIIELVNSTNEKHGYLIDMQVKHNADMRSIMAEAVSLLLQDHTPAEKQTTIQDYDADVTLF